MILTLPWPPSLNNAYPTITVCGKGRRVKGKAAKRYIKAVGQIVLAARAAEHLEFRIRLAIYMYPPDLRIRDISNHIKIVEDSLKAAGVMVDDEQIDDLHVYRMLQTKDGAVIVKIRESRRLFGAFPQQAEMLIRAGLSPLVDGAPM